MVDPIKSSALSSLLPNEATTAPASKSSSRSSPTVISLKQRPISINNIQLANSSNIGKANSNLPRGSLVDVTV